MEIPERRGTVTAKQFATRIQKIWSTQREAAEALGVTKGAVSHWELGRRPVPGSIVKLLECIETRLSSSPE